MGFHEILLNAEGVKIVQKFMRNQVIMLHLPADNKGADLLSYPQRAPHLVRLPEFRDFEWLTPSNCPAAVFRQFRGREINRYVRSGAKPTQSC